MVKMRVNRDKQDRTTINIPSFIREKFNLVNGGNVDVDTDGSRIIISLIEA